MNVADPAAAPATRAIPLDSPVLPIVILGVIILILCAVVVPPYLASVNQARTIVATHRPV